MPYRELDLDLTEEQRAMRDLARRFGSEVMRPVGIELDDLHDPADVIEGAQYGWNQSTARRVTFDELLGTGKFGLIRDRDLRVGIAEYYALDDSVHSRIDERETRYPHLSYQLVPRDDEFDLQRELSEDQIRLLVAGVFASQLQDHVIAETNLARFMRERLGALQTEGRQLIERLQTYLDTMS